MISLFILRSEKLNLNRQFKVSYPLVPAIALLIALVFSVAVTISNVSTASRVEESYAIAIIYYFVYSKCKVQAQKSNKDSTKKLMLNLYIKITDKNIYKSDIYDFKNNPLQMYIIRRRKGSSCKSR